MPVDHKEKAFESAIEHHLIASAGYAKAEQGLFDQERALDATQFVPFVKETQPDTWKKLEKLLGARTEEVLVDDLCKAMDSRGSLDVIRHGFKCYSEPVKVAYFAPAHGMNPEVAALYAKNRLTIVRQLLFKATSTKALDMTVCLNGIPRLPKRSIGPGVVFDDEVNLKYYRLQKTSEGSISLAPGDRGAVKAPTAVGTGGDHQEQIELSRLIDIVNQRFGTEFKPADQLFFDQIREEAVADTHIQQAAMANSLENFKYVFDKAVEGKFIDRMDQNQEIFARYMNDPAFANVVVDVLRKQVYDQIRADVKQETAQPR